MGKKMLAGHQLASGLDPLYPPPPSGERDSSLGLIEVPK